MGISSSLSLLPFLLHWVLDGEILALNPACDFLDLVRLCVSPTHRDKNHLDARFV